MDFIQTARKLERESVEIYRELAARCTSHSGIRTILNMLADDHEKHLKLFGDIKDKSCTGLKESGAFAETRRLFEEMQAKKNAFSCDLDQLKLYEEARELAAKKQKIYSEAAGNTECSTDRETIKKIAEEEEKQIIVLENIIQMVNRPNTWIEDAEFNHLDPY